jgi:hypothetical protein
VSPLFVYLVTFPLRKEALPGLYTSKLQKYLRNRQMKIALRNKYLSRQRFNRYLLATGYNNSRAKKLYAANIRLAQAFHPILGQFEVVLRNSLNAVLASHFADPDWIINQKTGFMRHPSLASSNYFLKTCVQKSENNLTRRYIPITAGKIISDQMFGFWVAFYVPHHYALVGGQSIYVFPHKPAIENRATIHRRLEEIKNFRNRMNHCEPLCFNANNIDCTYAMNIRAALYDLIRWIEPELVSYFRSIDTVETKRIQIMSV